MIFVSKYLDIFIDAIKIQHIFEQNTSYSFVHFIIEKSKKKLVLCLIEILLLNFFAF